MACEQELKGNIRVFCRVRPLGPNNLSVDMLDDGQPLITFPTEGAELSLASNKYVMLALGRIAAVAWRPPAGSS